jgi:hypothetical protein
VTERVFLSDSANLPQKNRQIGQKMSNQQDGHGNGKDKETSSSAVAHVSASSNMATYSQAMLFGLVFWAIIIFFYVQVRPTPHSLRFCAVR